MSGRVACYGNKTTIDYEQVAAMEVTSERNVKVIFKSGAVVSMNGYQGLASGFQEYMKSKHSVKD